MKKYLFILIGFIAIVAIGLLIGLRSNTDKGNPYSHSTVKEPNNITPTKPVLSDTKPKLKNVVDGSDIRNANLIDLDNEQPAEDVDTSEKQKNYNWLTDDPPESKQNKRDPFTEHLLVEQAKATGILIEGDITKMSPEERRNAIHRHMLRQFGDIPAVHTMTEFQRKKDENIEITLQEQLEGQKAVNELFPSDSTRKSIIFLEWAISKGGSYNDIMNITPSDIEQLRNLGIAVETENVGNAGSRIKISTK